MEPYITALNSIRELPTELERLLREKFFPVHIAHHECLLKPCQVNRNLYFIEKGLFHTYALDDGYPITLQFNWEDQFVLPYISSANAEKEMPEGIEALEDSIVWCLPESFVEELCQSQHRFNYYYSDILVSEFRLKKISLGCASHPTDYENLRYLREHFSDLLNRVPPKYLASFTCMSVDRFRGLLDGEILVRNSFRRRRRR